MRNLIIILLILAILLKLTPFILKYFYEIPAETLLYLEIAGRTLSFIILVFVIYGIYTSKIKGPKFLRKR